MTDTRRWLPLATLSWLILLLVATLWPMRLPPALAESAATGEFSAARALRHVEAVASMPHPAGSPAAARARDYIVRRLAALGLDPRLQAATAVRARSGLVTAGRVENILARLPGTASTRALLLACHYESVSGAPGAGDDGHAVGVLLETARALLAGPRLRNDVILLFDFEEVGLLGAKAFVREDPWARDVGLVLNFEARGTSGPGLMFETSRGNGWMVRQLARTAPFPVASSLSYEVYRRMPNDTDLAVFKRNGMAGMNFAYIENPQFYHTALDDPAHLDPRTLQHQGGYALSLARAFGAADLRAVRAPDAVYFRVPWNALVVYSAAWMWALAALSALSLLLLLWVGFRRGEFTAAGLAAGAGLFLGVLVVVPAAVAVIWALAGPLFALSLAYRLGVYSGGLAALAAAIFVAVYGWAARRVRPADLAAGALLWTAAALPVACRLSPGATYIIAWPLAAALVVLYALITDGGWWRVAVLAAGAAVPIYLLGGVAQQVFVGLGMSGLIPAAVLVVLLGGFLLPQLLALGAGYGHAAAGALLGFALLAGGLATLRYDAAHPLRDNLFYALDSDTGKAVWASLNSRGDAFTARFFSRRARPARLPEFTTADCLWGPALPKSLAPPEVTVLEKRFEAGIRAARLRIRSPRGATGLLILVTSRAQADAGAVDGRRWTAPPAPPHAARTARRILTFDNLPPEGAEFAFVWKGPGPLELRVIDTSEGLPEIPGQASPVRPPGIIRAPVWRYYNDTTLVGRWVTLR